MGNQSQSQRQYAQNYQVQQRQGYYPQVQGRYAPQMVPQPVMMAGPRPNVMYSQGGAMMARTQGTPTSMGYAPQRLVAIPPNQPIVQGNVYIPQRAAYVPPSPSQIQVVRDDSAVVVPSKSVVPVVRRSLTPVPSGRTQIAMFPDTTDYFGPTTVQAAQVQLAPPTTFARMEDVQTVPQILGTSNIIQAPSPGITTNPTIITQTPQYIGATQNVIQQTTIPQTITTGQNLIQGITYPSTFTTAPTVFNPTFPQTYTTANYINPNVNVSPYLTMNVIGGTYSQLPLNSTNMIATNIVPTQEYTTIATNQIQGLSTVGGVQYIQNPQYISSLPQYVQTGDIQALGTGQEILYTNNLPTNVIYTQNTINPQQVVEASNVVTSNPANVISKTQGNLTASVG